MGWGLALNGASQVLPLSVQPDEKQYLNMCVMGVDKQDEADYDTGA